VTQTEYWVVRPQERSRPLHRSRALWPARRWLLEQARTAPASQRWLIVRRRLGRESAVVHVQRGRRPGGED
jgi:hypothetical protein